MIKRSPSNGLVPHCTITLTIVYHAFKYGAYCIEGNPTTRRIKVDSSYLLPQPWPFEF